jgi:hypothetical protein
MTTMFNRDIENHIQSFLQKVEEALRTSSKDAQERKLILEELENQIRTELETNQGATLEDLKGILNKMDPPSAYGEYQTLDKPTIDPASRVSMVLGLISALFGIGITSFFIWLGNRNLIITVGTSFLLGFILGIAAIVTGHISSRNIKRSAGTLSGNGFAMTGLVSGYVMLVYSILGFAAFIVIFTFRVS